MHMVVNDILIQPVTACYSAPQLERARTICSFPGLFRDNLTIAKVLAKRPSTENVSSCRQPLGVVRQLVELELIRAHRQTPVKNSNVNAHCSG
jgi:hypothetical protein